VTDFRHRTPAGARPGLSGAAGILTSRHDVAVWNRLSFGAHRRCHSADRAIGLDGRAISVGQVPLAPVDRVCRSAFRVQPWDDT